jgi:hypothetical protein
MGHPETGAVLPVGAIWVVILAVQLAAEEGWHGCLKGTEMAPGREHEGNEATAI